MKSYSLLFKIVSIFLFIGYLTLFSCSEKGKNENKTVEKTELKDTLRNYEPYKNLKRLCKSELGIQYDSIINEKLNFYIPLKDDLRPTSDFSSIEFIDITKTDDEEFMMICSYYYSDLKDFKNIEDFSKRKYLHLNLSLDESFIENLLPGIENATGVLFTIERLDGIDLSPTNTERKRVTLTGSVLSIIYEEN
jgi:hypothetical protein